MHEMTKSWKIRLAGIGLLAAAAALSLTACSEKSGTAGAGLALAPGQTLEEKIEGKLNDLSGFKEEEVIIGVSEAERKAFEEKRRTPPPVMLNKVILRVAVDAKEVNKLLDDGAALAITLENPQLNEIRLVFDAEQGGPFSLDRTWEFTPESTLASVSGVWKVRLEAAGLKDVKYTYTVTAIRGEGSALSGPATPPAETGTGSGGLI